MDNNNILDLHGIRHHEVDRLVENFIFMNQDTVPLKIICGNSQKMIDLVLDVVKKHNIATTTMVQYGIIDIYKI
jgi:hypothetical protein